MFTVGKSALFYFFEIGEGRRSFFFTPSILNKEFPSFSLKREQEGWVVPEDGVDPLLFEQAVEEVEELLSSNIPQQIDSLIRESFLHPASNQQRF